MQNRPERAPAFSPDSRLRGGKTLHKATPAAMISYKSFTRRPLQRSVMTSGSFPRRPLSTPPFWTRFVHIPRRRFPKGTYRLALAVPARIDSPGRLCYVSSPVRLGIASWRTLRSMWFPRVSAGHICVDITPRFASDDADRTLEEMLRPGSLTVVAGAAMSSGGAAANVGLSARRLGLSVAMMGKCGDALLGTMPLEIPRRSSTECGGHARRSRRADQLRHRPRPAGGRSYFSALSRRHRHLRRRRRGSGSRGAGPAVLFRVSAADGQDVRRRGRAGPALRIGQVPRRDHRAGAWPCRTRPGPRAKPTGGASSRRPFPTWTCSSPPWRS